MGNCIKTKIIFDNIPQVINYFQDIINNINVVVGIDLTKANQNHMTLGVENLHFISSCLREEMRTEIYRPNLKYYIELRRLLNPYQYILLIISKLMQDIKKPLYLYGFNKNVICIKNNAIVKSTIYDKNCDLSFTEFLEVLPTYNFYVDKFLNLSEESDIIQIIRKGVLITCVNKSYTILPIITPQVPKINKELIETLDEASKYPMSIIIIGIGDNYTLTTKNKIPNKNNFHMINFKELELFNGDCLIPMLMYNILEIAKKDLIITKRLKLVNNCILETTNQSSLI